MAPRLGMVDNSVIVDAICPKCGDDDVSRLHHGPDALGECWYFYCWACEHQWGFA